VEEVLRGSWNCSGVVFGGKRVVGSGAGTLLALSDGGICCVSGSWWEEWGECLVS